MISLIWAIPMVYYTSILVHHSIKTWEDFNILSVCSISLLVFENETLESIVF